MKNMELYKRDPLYRFFTNEIDDLERRIKNNSDKIKVLGKEQESLKRGRAKMAELRREILNRI